MDKPRGIINQNVYLCCNLLGVVFSFASVLRSGSELQNVENALTHSGNIDHDLLATIFVGRHLFLLYYGALQLVAASLKG